MTVTHEHHWQRTGTFSGAGGINGSMARCDCGARKDSGILGGEQGCIGQRIHEPDGTVTMDGCSHYPECPCGPRK